MAKTIRVELSVIGRDRKGIVSAITSFIFFNGGNIEQINQNVAHGIFMMHLEASFLENHFQKSTFEKQLFDEGKKLGVEVKLHYEKNRKKQMAVFVTKEPHCLKALLEAWKKKELSADIRVIISNHKTLSPLAHAYNIPFHVVDSPDVEKREAKILSILEKNEVDFLVLARYMKILSPQFVWRFPNRIINIHPSLLPAFPGAHAYTQAFERGVKLVGCSAHFVTADLDQGPIIWQEAFAVKPSDTLQTIKEKGQKLEARVLLKGVKLYLQGKLQVYWGKVAIKNQ
jgi:formyltetrahydrofolate deformylase